MIGDSNTFQANYYRRLKEFSKRPEAKISGLISLTIFTISFFGIFAIMPTFKTIAKLNKDIQDAETVRNQLAKKIFSLEKAQELYSQQVDNLPLIDKVLPPQVNFERLSWQLYWLIKEKNLSLVSSNFDEFLIVGTRDPVETAPPTITLEITVKGNFNQIKEFSAELLKFDRLMTITQTTISSKKTKSNDNAITANFKLLAHWLPEQK